MRYVLLIILCIFALLLCLPFYLITWEWDMDDNGYFKICEGFGDMLGTKD
jgi:hypothetical protein